MSIRAPRLVAAGALAIAAVAAPIAVALSGAEATETAGPCLAWYGNREDGVCMGYSNGTPFNGGFGGGIYGPGDNWQNGPIIPGQSWNKPIA